MESFGQMPQQDTDDAKNLNKVRLILFGFFIFGMIAGAAAATWFLVNGELNKLKEETRVNLDALCTKYDEYKSQINFLNYSDYNEFLNSDVNKNPYNCIVCNS